ncbi:MAG: 2Fe-2S iron-sulfur cluster binding domain-containing protein [Methylococcaceae bacterium]|nr:MAG: 2Fe-2S iron-sulfur cluster binding domain-containing protein [Methylococcaceae bacterium]
MPQIHHEGDSYVTEGDESVLDCLLRHGVSVSYGCKAGACQSCLMQAGEGALPPESQKGLKDTQKYDKQFLACMCRPQADLEVAKLRTVAKTYTSQVIEIEHLSAEIVRIRLAQPDGFSYRAGQFINIVTPNNVSRSYSLASVPELDDYLELHVRRIPSGLVSTWLCDHLKVNAHLTISEAMGQCFYVPTRHEQPLLLIGTGSGLAPLYGIARDALRQGHSGPIHLYHGSSHQDGIYYVEEMSALADQHPHFNYTPTLSRPHELPKIQLGRAHEMALKSVNRLSGWRLYLCGHPEMVQGTKQKAFIAGASLQDIYTDPFTFTQHPPKAV